MTFSNPLFDCNDDFTSSDDKSLSNKDFPMKNFKIYSNPLLDEEFFGELAYINPIPPGIEETDFDLKDEIRLVENLLNDTSSPQPPKDLNAKVTDTIIESLSPPPIPVENSDSLMEEIDLFLDSDYSIPPGIESNYYDSEGDILFLKNLLNDDSPEVKSDHESDQSEMITFSPENDPLHYRFTGGIIPNLPRIARDHEEYLNMMTLLCEISNSQENLHANPIPDDLTPPGVKNDSEYEDVSTFLPDDELFSLNNSDDPSLPHPPPEPPDICLSFEPKTAIKKDFVKLNEDFNQGGRILSQNVEEYDSFTFIIWKFFSFLTFLKDSPLLLSLRSEDTIFDPGISTFHFLSKAGCISSGWNFHMFIQTFMNARLRFSLPFASPRTT
ncbi:hypothetical protein Tco_1527752 [Tanacetum coccineum]